MAKYDFSEFGPQERKKEKYDFSEFDPASAATRAQPETPKVSTFLGEMPAIKPSAITHDKDVIEKTIQSAAMLPGMGVVGETFGYPIVGMPTLKGIGQALQKGGKAVVAPFIAASGKYAGQAEEAAQQAQAMHQRAAQEEQEAKHEAVAETGLVNPAKMKHAVTEKQAQLQEPTPQVTQNYPLGTNATAERATQTQAEHEAAQKATQQIESGIRQHLNEGAVHDVEAAKGIRNVQENQIKADISQQFKDIEQSLSNKNVTLPADSSREAKDIAQDLIKLNDLGKGGSEKAQKLFSELATIGKNNIVPANDYLAAYRTARDYAREARTEAFRPGMKADERAEWQKKYKELDEQVDKMEQVLKEAIGPEDAAALDKAGYEWRTKVVPLYRNPTYQTILKKGRIESNIMRKLRGTDPGDVLMRNIIHENPEIGRHVIGQQFAHNPAGLHEITDLEREYINHMPNLQHAITSHRQALQQEHIAGEAAVEARTAHGARIKQEQREAKKIEKEQAKVSQHAEKKSQLEHEIELLQKHIEQLKKSESNAKVSLEQKIKLEKELKKATKQMNTARLTLGSLLLGSAFHPIKKVSSLLGLGEE
jgi:hypothetical protein